MEDHTSPSTGAPPQQPPPGQSRNGSGDPPSYDFDDLRPVEIPVRWQGRDYLLREASEDAASKFQRIQFRNAKIVDGKPQINLENSPEAAKVLLAGCLFELYRDRDRGGREAIKERPVTLQQLQEWPQRITQKLFSRAMKISELSAPDTVESVEKQIRDLQGKLQELRAARARDGETGERDGGGEEEGADWTAGPKGGPASGQGS